MDFTLIPDDIKALPQWTPAKLVPDVERSAKAGKPKTKKVPLNLNGKYVDPSNPANWVTFPEVEGYIRAHPELQLLPRFCPKPGDGIYALDLDEIIDPATGVVDPRAQEILDKFAGYAEYSQSRTGIHILFKSTLPLDKKNWQYKGLKVEIGDGFGITLTGNKLPDTESKLLNNDGALGWLRSECAPLKAESAQENQRQTVEVPGSCLSDDEVLAKARKSKNGAAFAALFDRGGADGCDDDSAKDFKLCKRLLFWTGGDTEQAIRLFSQSALGQREKWTTRPDYQKLTAKNALKDILNKGGKFYTPRGEAAEGGELPELVQGFLSEYFTVFQGGKFLVGFEGMDGVVLTTPEELRKKYCNQLVSIPGVKHPQNPVDIWLHHRDRQDYEGLIFQPDKYPKGYYNLWEPTSWNSYWPSSQSSGDCSLFWELTFEVICGGRQSVYEWVRKWLSHLRQRPWELPGTALVIRGGQGTGKSTFADIVGRLVNPRHYLTITSIERLTGRFKHKGKSPGSAGEAVAV